ncbi:hypothetical protein RI367_000896 [Sorochytrium milnesiophthora]
MAAMNFLRSLGRTKSLEALMADSDVSEMHRKLTWFDLIMLGIGEIIGAGIFVSTGRAAHDYAGPAVIISFLIAGLVCAFAGLCYAEMASMIPVAGSAYTYAYATCGELVAWIVGWDLMLEYLAAASVVAAGWADHLSNLIQNVSGSPPSQKLFSSPWSFPNNVMTPNGNILNLPAIGILILCTIVLVIGIRHSAIVNHILVGIKVFVVLMFLIFTYAHIDSKNWSPFIPPNAGPEKYGFSGITKAATVVFFAYIGFDAVSTLSQEARNPKRDMPIGILGSLLVCTVLYILVSINITGIVNYKVMDTEAPLASAVTSLGMHWLAILIDIGGLCGLTSVILVSLMGQPRVWYSMAYDGLFPAFFAKVHPDYGTPFVPTIISGAIACVLAALLPEDVLGDLTSVGTLLAFALVSLAVGIMRFTRPDAKRDFRVPLGPVVIPFLGFASSIFLITQTGAVVIYRLLAWMALGLIVYFAYGRRHSKVGRGVFDQSPPVAMDSAKDLKKEEEAEMTKL